MKREAWRLKLNATQVNSIEQERIASWDYYTPRTTSAWPANLTSESSSDVDWMVYRSLVRDLMRDQGMMIYGDRTVSHELLLLKTWPS